ncbi:hypothetical protein B5S33_g2097 [[Candida] boidinii]|nr:hypothetical protein B5S33_g2097 [[Candida] boidinii]
MTSPYKPKGEFRRPGSIHQLNRLSSSSTGSRVPSLSTKSGFRNSRHDSTAVRMNLFNTEKQMSQQEDKENCIGHTKFTHSKYLETERKALDRKLFSSRLASSVLNEFNSRYETAKSNDGSHQNALLNSNSFQNHSLRPNLSERKKLSPISKINSAHRSRFNRMESISDHYAARRDNNKKESKHATTPKSRLEVINKKQLNESASKRLKTSNGDAKDIYYDSYDSSQESQVSDSQSQEGSKTPTPSGITENTRSSSISRSDSSSSLYHRERKLPSSLDFKSSHTTTITPSQSKIPSLSRLGAPRTLSNSVSSPDLRSTARSQIPLPSYARPTNASLHRSTSTNFSNIRKVSDPSTFSSSSLLSSSSSSSVSSSSCISSSDPFNSSPVTSSGRTMTIQRLQQRLAEKRAALAPSSTNINVSTSSFSSSSTLSSTVLGSRIPKSSSISMMPPLNTRRLKHL